MSALLGCRARTQISALGGKSSCRDPSPSLSLHMAASAAKLRTRALNPALSCDYRDERWALSPFSNTHVTLLLLQPAGKPVFYTTSPVPARDQSRTRCLGSSRCPAHFSHTGSPSDSSPWYCNYLPGDKSLRRGSSGGEKQQKLPKGSQGKKKRQSSCRCPSHHN